MLKPVIVNGAKGKMGSLACKALQNHADFEVVAELGRDDDLAKAIEQTEAKIVVELTSADCVYENSLMIISKGAHPVIGATGLLSQEIKELTKLCQKKQLGAIIAPNFSIAAVLMMIFSAKAAQYFPEVEIIEAHHQNKLDAPSGTALKTAEMISLARKGSKKELGTKELFANARGALVQDINIHSIRLPGILAKQEVIFGSQGETLTLTDTSIDRECFMPGIILACQKVLELKTLVYGLETII